jgi:hypothetical protein
LLLLLMLLLAVAVVVAWACAARPGRREVLCWRDVLLCFCFALILQLYFGTELPTQAPEDSVRHAAKW